jgi:hypothetical protein
MERIILKKYGKQLHTSITLPKVNDYMPEVSSLTTFGSGNLGGNSDNSHALMKQDILSPYFIVAISVPPNTIGQFRLLMGLTSLECFKTVSLVRIHSLSIILTSNMREPSFKTPLYTLPTTTRKYQITTIWAKRFT